MDVDKCIKERRSVREYLKKKISWPNVSKILDAGIHAPCSGGIQNYNFIVVQSDKKRDDIARACNQLWMLGAPVFIIVCNNKEKIKKFYEDEADHYAVQNCAAAIENMLIQAQSFGISSCWVGSYDEIKLTRILKLPDNVNIEAIVVLGYSEDKPKMPKRFTIDRLTYFEEWGNIKK